MIMNENEIKRAVREALNEWVKEVEFLHSPESDEGRYYCSKANCEGVRFPTNDVNNDATIS